MLLLTEVQAETSPPLGLLLQPSLDTAVAYTYL